MIPGVVQNYFYPQWVESFGRHQDRRILARQIFRQMSRVAVLMVPISAIAALGIDVLVNNFLPQYAVGERAAQLACLAGPFFSFRLCTIYFAAVHQWKEYWIYTTMLAVLPFLLIPLFMIIMMPLESAVLGAVANLVLSGLALCFMTIRDVAKIPAQ